MKSLDILKKCVLVRDIVGILKQLLYKYKKYVIINHVNIYKEGEYFESNIYKRCKKARKSW